MDSAGVLVPYREPVDKSSVVGKASDGLWDLVNSLGSNEALPMKMNESLIKEVC